MAKRTKQGKMIPMLVRFKAGELKAIKHEAIGGKISKATVVRRSVRSYLTLD